MPEPVLYYDNNTTVWTWDWDALIWILTNTRPKTDTPFTLGLTVDASEFGPLLNTNSQFLRTSARRKNSNRMFAFRQTSDYKEGTPDKDKPILGDDRDITSTTLPFNE
jgi:hypothetical protein